MFIHVTAVILFSGVALAGPVSTAGVAGIDSDEFASAAMGDPCGDATITIEIMTDNYPSDTTWELVQQGLGVVASDGPLSVGVTLHTWDVCVESTGCYDFTIYDSYGDGLDSPAYFNVHYDGALAGSGGRFNYSDTVVDIGAGCQETYCGDGTCGPDETYSSCPEDCALCEYCAACYTERASEWITRVMFNTIDNRTGQDGPCSYGDYTSISTTVTRESSHTLRVSFFSDETLVEHVRAWIDWNQDCTFDSNESYYFGNGIDATLSKSITIPADAVLGCTRMRVVDNYDVDFNEPCPDLLYGEVEDYTVCVTGGALGACCVTTDPWCRGSLTEAECDTLGGTFLGIGSVCDLPDCNGNGIADQCDPVGNGDFNADGFVDLDDYDALTECLDGPDTSPSVPVPACLSTYLAAFDSDSDGDVDIEDFGAFCQSFTAP